MIAVTHTVSFKLQAFLFFIVSLFFFFFFFAAARLRAEAAEIEHSSELGARINVRTVLLSTFSLLSRCYANETSDCIS